MKLLRYTLAICCLATGNLLIGEVVQANPDANAVNIKNRAHADRVREACGHTAARLVENGNATKESLDQAVAKESSQTKQTCQDLTFFHKDAPKPYFNVIHK